MNPETNVSNDFSSTRIEFVTSLDGTPIHVQAKGNRDGAHIIFAPGLATSLAFFNKLFHDPSLYEHLYMVRFDPRGHGLSGKPTTADFYTSDRYGDDIKAIVEAFNLDKPFFAGWSIGATLLTDLAANYTHPLPFSGAITMDGPVYFHIEDAAEVTTPLGLEILGGLQNSTDVDAALQTRIDFVNALTADPDLNFTVASTWLGGTSYMFPSVLPLIAGRSQDETRLKEEGMAGWPILCLLGSEDKIIISRTASEPFSRTTRYTRYRVPVIRYSTKGKRGLLVTFYPLFLEFARPIHTRKD